MHVRYAPQTRECTRSNHGRAGSACPAPRRANARVGGSENRGRSLGTEPRALQLMLRARSGHTGSSGPPQAPTVCHSRARRATRAAGATAGAARLKDPSRPGHMSHSGIEHPTEIATTQSQRMLKSKVDPHRRSPSPAVSLRELLSLRRGASPEKFTDLY